MYGDPGIPEDFLIGVTVYVPYRSQPLHGMGTLIRTSIGILQGCRVSVGNIALSTTV